jgi:hypothetical protein
MAAVVGKVDEHKRRQPTWAIRIDGSDGELDAPGPIARSLAKPPRLPTMGAEPRNCSNTLGK